MKTILYTADSRGHADHGWLNAYHSFSFAGYFNPERHNFGVLRVLNDDTIAPGMGFGTHPHDNMEIITIPLEGDLAHKDSMGNAATIKNGDVQLVFNTTEGATAMADSRSLRRAALLHKVPYYTTLSGAVAAAQGIKAYLRGDLVVYALQSYFTDESDRESGQSKRRYV